MLVLGLVVVLRGQMLPCTATRQQERGGARVEVPLPGLAVPFPHRQTWKHDQVIHAIEATTHLGGCGEAMAQW